ncbi:hypothetical protein [Paraburkholderia sp. SIMBA_030]|uniref:hypothetical protein n=1 Tax=Paraburkholderia sp. SIMBA_030 TaxID=3085773 RepID=UPI00397C0203
MHRFFTAPKTWLLKIEREPGVLDFALEVLPEGKALVCFQSPVDAHIEGLLRARPDMRYYVTEAWAAHETWFLREPGLLMAFLHLAWVGQSGRMLLRPSGTPCRYFRSLRKSVEGEGPFTFEVDAGSLEVVDRLHEQAGLFAWRETVSHETSRAARMQMQELERHRELVDQAVRSARVITRPESRPGEELMLFDPKFRQWHTVSREAAETHE